MTHRDTPAGRAGHPDRRQPWRFLSAAEYLREFGHLMPERQWQPTGFLAQLEVADP